MMLPRFGKVRGGILSELWILQGQKRKIQIGD